jgi:IS30 family transposase
VLKKYVPKKEVEKLNCDDWSPEDRIRAVKKRSDLPTISSESIYRWIFKEKFDKIFKRKQTL